MKPRTGGLALSQSPPPSHKSIKEDPNMTPAQKKFAMRQAAKSTGNQQPTLPGMKPTNE